MATATMAPAVKEPLRVSFHSFSALWSESFDWLLRNFVQIGIALGIGAVLVAAMLLLRRLGRSLCDRQSSTTNPWPQTIARVVTQTQLWFMILFAAKLVDGYADPPPTVASTIGALFTIAAAIQGAIWVREFILAVVEHRAGGEHHAALSSAIGIIRLLVTVVLFAVALVLILDNLGVNVTGLIAGLGIGGIAIGLAAKGIFDDLFSALSIIFDRPFQRGDSIQWDKTNGAVEAIGLKTTRVRSVTGEEIVISNSNLLNKELRNLTRLNRRRTIVTLSVPYYTTADQCAKVPGLVRDVIEAHDKCKLVRCGLTNFGASSLDFELQYDVMSQLYDEVFSARHQISVALLRAFADAGIDWAWPTQVTIVGDANGRATGLLPVHTGANEGEAETEASSPNAPSPPRPMPASNEIAPE